MIGARHTLSKRPTSAHSREFGEELRQIRKQVGLTGTFVEQKLEWPMGKLSRLEGGMHGASDGDLGALLGTYGADKATRTKITRLSGEQDRGCFVRPHQIDAPDVLLCLRIHEACALTITCFEPLVVPPLAQTALYAQALSAPQTQVQARMERQEVLRGPSSPDTVFYIHEAALHLVVGDAATMHDQCMRLAFMCDWTRVTPRVVPLSAGAHAALRHVSAYLTFAGPLKPLAYAETDTATVFFDDAVAAWEQRQKFALLDRLALDVEQSRKIFDYWAGVYAPSDSSELLER
jgi:transcriptional regulator with XRE-family HTH domain